MTTPFCNVHFKIWRGAKQFIVIDRLSILCITHHTKKGLSSEVMIGRKIGLFVVCLVLLPAFTMSDSKWQYVVELSTGHKYRSGTEKDILIRIREDGRWHNLDNPDADDFERGQTDTFQFEDHCVDRHQQTTIGITVYQRYFACSADRWLLIYVKLMPKDRHWINEWLHINGFLAWTR